MFRAAWRSLVAHKLRLVLSVLAIALSVGFIVGTFIFSDTLNRTFTDLFAQTTTDVVVTPDTEFGGSGQAGELVTLPADLLGRIREVPGVAKAEGTVFADGVAIIGADDEPIGQGGAPQFGSNWSDDIDLTPYRLIDGEGPEASGQVAIDSVSAEAGNLAVGDTVRLITPTGETTADLVGVFRFGTSGNLAGATIAAFDTPTAQDLLLAGEEAFTEIDAVAAEGVSQDQLATDIRAVVGSDVQVRTGEEAADDAADAITDDLQFLNVFLAAFGFIALFVGAFLIWNTFSMLTSQRTRELALLRAVGATRGQVVRSVLAEALVVGSVGAALGCLLGFGVVAALKALFGSFGLELGSTPLAVEPSSFLVGVVPGLLFTLAAALFPAIRASRIPPVAALRDDATLPQRSLRLRTILGGVVLAVGFGVLITGATVAGGSGAQLVGLGVFLTLIGVIVFSAVLAAPVSRGIGWPLPRMAGTVGRLAVDNAARQPRRSAATASALMIGLALVSAMTVFAASTTDSLNAAIGRVIGAEFVVSTETQRPFPRAVADDLAEVDGVAVVSRSTFVEGLVDTGEGDATGTFVTAVDPATLSRVVDFTFDAGGMDGLQDGGLLVDRTTADGANLQVGDTVDLTFATGTGTFEVAGIYEPAGFFTGYAITNQGLEDAGVKIGDTFVYVKADDSADLDTLRAGIEGVLAAYPGVEVQSQAELKEQIQSSINQVLAVIVGLLGLAVIIAVLGIVNTLYLSVLERTREIGMLRAVGTSRRQVRRMIVLESVVIALFGAVLGVVLGVGFATALQRTVADLGINVLTIPWRSLVVYLLIAMVVGALAALWPARRAAKLDVLRAITTE